MLSFSPLTKKLNHLCFCMPCWVPHDGNRARRVWDPLLGLGADCFNLLPLCSQVMETASCMLLLSTCGVFRTQTWSWGRHSSALSRRQTHATLNSAGSWSPWNLRNLWKRGSAMTPGYVLFHIKHLLTKHHGWGEGTWGQPLLSVAYHRNLAKQSMVSGKHQKPPAGWPGGFCHCWKASGQQIPHCVYLFQLDHSHHGLPCGVLVVFWFDCLLHALLSQPVKFRPPHSQSQVWDFCGHLEEGLQCYASSGIFSEAGAVPILPHFWAHLVMEKSKGSKPKWGKQGDYLNDDL